MNSIPLDVIASSVPFRFLVGPNEREFTMHSALFTHQSPVLERLANGNFTEAAEKCVKWASVDEDTFIRFWQYTYTGKYTAAPPVTLAVESNPEANPEPTPTPPPPPPLSPSTVPSENIWVQRPPRVAPDPSRTSLLRQGHAVQPPKSETPEELKRKALWNAFMKQQSFDSFAMFHTFGAVRATRVADNPSNHDYTNTFLSHVRLFIFAECYGITALMRHSLNALHGTLEGFTLHEERVNDVVALVRYCYENPVPESLRNLVTLYAACKIDKLWKSEQFHALVEAHSELSMALLGLMVKEI